MFEGQGDRSKFTITGCETSTAVQSNLRKMNICIVHVHHWRSLMNELKLLRKCALIKFYLKYLLKWLMWSWVTAVLVVLDDGLPVYLYSQSWHRPNISPMNASRLSALENVREIRDYLYVNIKHPDFKSLRFLRNLRIIRGKNLWYETGFLVFA